MYDIYSKYSTYGILYVYYGMYYVYPHTTTTSRAKYSHGQKNRPPPHFYRFLTNISINIIAIKKPSRHYMHLNKGFQMIYT
jgi:hypothetical protein